MHITGILSKIYKKYSYFKGTFPRRNLKLEGENVKFIEEINRQPSWVSYYKDYANFGKFVDYMVRKMCITYYPDKCVIFPIQAEKVSESLEYVKWTTKINDIHKNQQVYRWHEVKNPKLFYDFVAQRDTPIKHYYDKNIHWRECIPSMYYLAVLDNLYVDPTDLPFNKKITKKKLTSTCMEYLEHIATFVKEHFKNANAIYLNPDLSHDKMVSGEADLMMTTDAHVYLYDIKVTWNTNKMMKRSYYQLLGYVAMHDYLLKHDKKNPICTAGRIDRMGFIFPNQLEAPVQNVHRWTDEKRKKYLQKLRSAPFITRRK